MIEKIYKATGNDINTRLDTYVSSLNPTLSRSMVKKIISNRKIFVNEKIVKDSYKMKKGDIVKVIIEPPKETKLEAQEIELDIIYEDNDIIVVNKNKGMVVHPGNGNKDNTLVNAILAHCKENLSGIGGELRPRDSS